MFREHCTTRAELASSNQDDVGPALLIPRALHQRTLLINKIEIASTEDVVHEGQHDADADDDHEACLGKRSCL
jgi:hypothetical protein